MKVSIIIPVYNEAKTITEILNRVRRAELPSGFTKEIIVVDDASDDATSQILAELRKYFNLISHSQNLGKGAAISSGLRQARGDVVLIQDADLEYSPKDYVRLLQPFSDSQTQVVYGSRLLNYPLRLFGHDKTPLPWHLVANRFLSFFTCLLYGSIVTDMETGYKVVRRKLLLSLNLVSQRFDFEPEVTAKLLKRNIKIVEIPVKVQPRDYSQGKKIGFKDGLIAAWTLVKYRFVD